MQGVRTLVTVWREIKVLDPSNKDLKLDTVDRVQEITLFLGRT